MGLQKKEETVLEPKRKTQQWRKEEERRGFSGEKVGCTKLVPGSAICSYTTRRWYSVVVNIYRITNTTCGANDWLDSEEGRTREKALRREGNV